MKAVGWQLEDLIRYEHGFYLDLIEYAFTVLTSVSFIMPSGNDYWYNPTSFYSMLMVFSTFLLSLHTPIGTTI